MHQRQFFFFTSSLLLIITSTSAFSADLMQVFSDASANSLRFKASSVDYQIAAERRNEIMAEYDSELTLKVTPSYVFSASERSNRRDRSSGRVNSSNSDEVEVDYRLGLNKPLYNRQLNHRISQAGSMLEQEEAFLDSQRQALFGRVTDNYFNFLIAQNKLKFSLLEQNAIQQNLNQLNVLFRAQQATITDVKETESRLDQALFSTASARNNVDDVRKNLQIMTGQHYDTLATLNTNRQFVKLEPSSVNGWLRLAQNSSHEIVAANRELDIQEKDIFIQQAESTTTLDLFARYEGSSVIGGSSSKRFSDRDGKVGFEINIPLYQGDKVASKVRGANFKLKKAHYELEFKKREIGQQVKFSYQRIMTDIENIRALQRAVISSELALQNMRKGRVAGTRTMTDVLSSLRESFQVKRSYTDARYTYLQNIFKLKQAAGVLSVDDLRLVNKLLGHSESPVNMSSDALHSMTTPLATPLVGLGSLEDAWDVD